MSASTEILEQMFEDHRCSKSKGCER